MKHGAKSWMLGAVAVTALSGCAYLGNIGNALIGVSQVQQAPEIRVSLVEYLDAQTLLSIHGELAFFDDAYAAIVKLDPRTSFVKFALSAPDVAEDAGKHFNAIENAVLAYAERTETRVPAELVAFAAGVKPAYADLLKAIDTSDTVRTVMEYLRLIKPLVALAVL